MSRCVGLFGNRSMLICRAKQRCGGFFGTDANLKKGCKSWVKTLDRPQDFQSADDYLKTLNQELVIATYGVDLVKDDDVTENTVFGDNSQMYIFFGCVILLLVLLLMFRK